MDFLLGRNSLRIEWSGGRTTCQIRDISVRSGYCGVEGETAVKAAERRVGVPNCELHSAELLALKAESSVVFLFSLWSRARTAAAAGNRFRPLLLAAVLLSCAAPYSNEVESGKNGILLRAKENGGACICCWDQQHSQFGDL